jgi:NADPH2:quinone reductase
MKAIFLVRNGESRDAFEMRDIPVPVPGKGEILVRVEASGLNYADVMARRGLYKAAPPLPSILGYDVAGTVHAVGPETRGYQTGQRVAAMTRFGGYAEYAVTQAGAVIPLPDTMEPAPGTALATQASTAVYSACLATRLYPGDRVLVHAAAGGVGTILVQIAKERGCIVYGSASIRKHSYLKDIGVDYPIDSHGEDPLKALTDTLDGHKLDVVFDNIGGNSFRNGLALLGAAGRIVAYGAAAQNLGKRSGRINSIRVGLGFGFHSPIGLLVKSQSVIGVNMLAIADHKPVILKEVMEEVARLAAKGTIRPVLGRVFASSQIAEAHDFLESRKSTGKTALIW